MIGIERIKALSNRIVKEFKPERIVLFGSYAYGSPRPDSDVDLLVIMRFRGNALSKAAEVVTKIKPQFSVDVLFRRREDVEFRLANHDCFMREIFERGRVLYESSDGRMDNEG